MTCIDVTVIFVFPNYPTMIGILLCDLAYFTQLRCWENINIYPQDDQWRATVKDGEVELSFDNLIYCMRFSRLRFSFFCYLIWRVVIGFLSPITPFFFFFLVWACDLSGNSFPIAALYDLCYVGRGICLFCYVR